MFPHASELINVELQNLSSKILGVISLGSFNQKLNEINEKTERMSNISTIFEHELKQMKRGKSDHAKVYDSLSKRIVDCEDSHHQL